MSSFRPHLILNGRFELRALLGRGGMGEVWRAHDRDLDLQVAVKLLHPHLATATDAVAFMKNECRAARGLNHPNIVRVHDFHQQADLAFISMEWIDGPTFDRWPLRTAGGWRAPVEALAAVADALEDIHRQGLVHRDVKARNILMTADDQPKLTDFGIVGVWRLQPGMLDLQSGGSGAGMSPQQRAGRPPVPADDIYAFGVLLEETLDGITRPFSGSADGEAAHRLGTPVDGPGAGDHRPPADLQALATAMQAPRRRDRPGSMRSVKQSLAAMLSSGDSHTTPPTMTTRPARADAMSPEGERITPEPYTPSTERSPAAARRGPVIGTLLLVAAAAALIAAGIWGIGYLAEHPLTTARPVRSPQPSPPAPPQTATPAERPLVSETPAPPPDAAGLSAAEDRLARWLPVKNALQDARASAWAPEPAAAIEALARQADDAMMARRYAEASQNYAMAAQDGQALLERRQTLRSEALQQGRDNLQADRPDEARRHFERALEIQPDDPAARQGLAAADQRVKILALMGAGRTHESEGRYDLALTDYEAARKLDENYPPAARAVARLKDQLADSEYSRLVSDGLNAFYANRLGEARRHIRAALAYRPDGHEAREALRQVNAAAREQQIAQLRRQGQAAETAEQWDRALKAYEAARAIDDGLRFARQGAARSRARVRIEKRLQYYRDRPEALTSDRYLAEAQALLDEALAIDPRGPRLTGQIQTLQAAIQAAQRRIPVTVISDGQTEVAVLRVARLGRITHEVLALRPGTYTIVGVRNGYRDVRRTIRIAADQQALQVSIACHEKI
jgi:serine/threonine protein kinase